MGSVDVLTREPIAIVGMASRFPQGADTVDHLWDFLLEARQAMTDFPSCRVNREAHYHPDPEHGGTVSQQSMSISWNIQKSLTD